MKSLQELARRNADVAMVLVVLGVLMVLFVPVPRLLLDFLILANFAFAFLLLLLTFYFQFAALGMLEAVDRYDPDRGVQFRTYAARRMQGAILSGLERMTEKQQQIAARQRLRAERLQEVSQMAGDRAEHKQGAEAMMQFVSEVGIGLAVCWMLEGTAMVEDEAAARSIPFYQGAAVRQMRARLLEAVESLPAAERTIIRSHYLQDVPFEEVAGTLSLSKGRISQLHKQALTRLRALVRDHADWNATF